jgi:hypothetical protein
MVRLSKIGIEALITYVFMGLAALGWGAFVFLFNRPEDYPHGFGGYTPLGVLVFFIFPPVMLILSVALPIWLRHKGKRAAAVTTPVVSLVIWIICCILILISLHG